MTAVYFAVPSGVCLSTAIHIFLKSFDIPAEVSAIAALEEKEAHQLDILNAANLLRTDSMMYGFIARVADAKGSARSIETVFDAAQNKYLYWYEK